MSILKKRNSGFTLIELMIAVAVAAILAGIAYPSYTEYVKKGRRSDAKAGLLDLQLKQEKFRANCSEYADSMSNTAADYSCDTATETYTMIPSPGNYHDGNFYSPDNNYILSIVSATASAYTLKATRTGLQTDDKCGDFQIDQVGNKSVVDAASGYDAAKCW